MRVLSTSKENDTLSHAMMFLNKPLAFYDRTAGDQPAVPSPPDEDGEDTAEIPDGSNMVWYDGVEYLWKDRVQLCEVFYRPAKARKTNFNKDLEVNIPYFYVRKDRYYEDTSEADDEDEIEGQTTYEFRDLKGSTLSSHPDRVGPRMSRINKRTWPKGVELTYFPRYSNELTYFPRYSNQQVKLPLLNHVVMIGHGRKLVEYLLPPAEFAVLQKNFDGKNQLKKRNELWVWRRGDCSITRFDLTQFLRPAREPEYEGDTDEYLTALIGPDDGMTCTVFTSDNKNITIDLE